jgi:putative peptidoglycan lipid II flippase
MSVIRKLVSANAIIFVGLLIGFLNNVAISAFFGLSRSIDAYFAAGILGSIFLSLIVDYVSRNFLPIYSKRFNDSPEQASDLTSSIVVILTLFSVLVVVILLYFARTIFDFLLPGFNDEDLSVTTKMFAIQAPSIIFMTVNNVHEYVWQHAENYMRVVIARIFLPLALFFFIVAGYLLNNVYALAMGFLAGHICAFIIMSYGVPYKFRPQLNFGDSDVRKILTNSSLLTVSGLVTRLRGPISQYFGSLLGSGAIAAITLANKICRPIYESALLGVRMIVFARASQEAALGNTDKLSELYNFSINAVLLAVVPIATWVGLNNEALIIAIFKRGEFTDSMANLVTLALYGAVPSMVLFGLMQLLSNSFYALQRIVIPLIVLPIGTGIFFVAAKLLSTKFGIFGLTLAGSVAAAFTSLVLTIALHYVLPKFSAIQVMIRLFLYLTASLLGGYLGLFVTKQLGTGGVAGLIITLAVLAITYVAFLALVRDRIFLRVWHSLRKEFFPNA